jgi:hypothetical protein
MLHINLSFPLVRLSTSLHQARFWGNPNRVDAAMWKGVHNETDEVALGGANGVLQDDSLKRTAVVGKLLARVRLLFRSVPCVRSLAKRALLRTRCSCVVHQRSSECVEFRRSLRRSRTRRN